MKSRQSAQIQKIAEALVAAGFLTIEAQAEVLGLARSTTWNLLNGHYKSSGISAKILNRILASPKLPPAVRAGLVEYVEEKASGSYGHSVKLRRKFINRIGVSSTKKIRMAVPTN